MKKIFISIFSTLFVLTGFAQNIHQRGGGTATDTCLEVGFTRKDNILSAANKTGKFVTLTDSRGLEMRITVDSFATGGGGYTNLTQFVDQTAWRSFYSNGSGDITELAFGTSGQVLTSNGASSAPTWQTPSSGSGTINSGTGFKIPFYDGTGTTLSQTSGLYYTNGTTENFGIGASAPSSELEVLSGTAKTGAFSDNPAAAAFVSPNYSLTSGGATAHFVSNSAMGADVGGSITFGGDRTSSVNNSSTTFAIIKGAKESASSGNFNGYLAIGVQNHNGGTIIEALRINSSGSVGIGTSSPSASALLDVSSTTKGALMPRMTSTQRDAISSPATGLELFNTTTNTKQIYDGTRWVEAAHPLYKVYTALLTQSGTDAPTATVLENNLGGTVVWARSDIGEYTATLTGAFTVDKTFLPNRLLLADVGIYSGSLEFSRTSADVIAVNSYDAASDFWDPGVLGPFYVEIRVYY